MNFWKFLLFPRLVSETFYGDEMVLEELKLGEEADSTACSASNMSVSSYVVLKEIYSIKLKFLTN